VFGSSRPPGTRVHARPGSAVGLVAEEPGPPHRAPGRLIREVHGQGHCAGGRGAGERRGRGGGGGAPEKGRKGREHRLIGSGRLDIVLPDGSRGPVRARHGQVDGVGPGVRVSVDRVLVCRHTPITEVPEPLDRCAGGLVRELHRERDRPGGRVGGEGRLELDIALSLRRQVEVDRGRPAGSTLNCLVDAGEVAVEGDGDVMHRNGYVADLGRRGYPGIVPVQDDRRPGRLRSDRESKPGHRIREHRRAVQQHVPENLQGPDRVTDERNPRRCGRVVVRFERLYGEDTAGYQEKTKDERRPMIMRNSYPQRPDKQCSTSSGINTSKCSHIRMHVTGKKIQFIRGYRKTDRFHRLAGPVYL